jgi:hypothetical protein
MADIDENVVYSDDVTFWDVVNVWYNSTPTIAHMRINWTKLGKIAPLKNEFSLPVL